MFNLFSTLEFRKVLRALSLSPCWGLSRLVCATIPSCRFWNPWWSGRPRPDRRLSGSLLPGRRRAFPVTRRGRLPQCGTASRCASLPQETADPRQHGWKRNGRQHGGAFWIVFWSIWDTGEQLKPGQKPWGKARWRAPRVVLWCVPNDAGRRRTDGYGQK